MIVINCIITIIYLPLLTFTEAVVSQCSLRVLFYFCINNYNKIKKLINSKYNIIGKKIISKIIYNKNINNNQAILIIIIDMTFLTIITIIIKTITN